MEIVIKKEFNIIYEIAELMGYSYLPEAYTREKVKAEFEEQGVHKDKLFNDIYDMIEETVAIFEKQMVRHEDDVFFFDDEDISPMTMSLVLYLSKHQELLNDTSLVDEKQVYEALAMEWFEKVPEDLQEIMILLEDSEWELKSSVKWKLLMIFDDPVKYIIRFIHMINRNIPAFEATLKKQRRLMDTLVVQLEQQKELFKPIFEMAAVEWEKTAIFEGVITVNPMLVGAGSFFTYDGGLNYWAGYYFREMLGVINGLLSETIEDVSPLLKLLGDNSKFEILKFLKQAPSYNLEIANHLELTPATTSHHMNTLLINGLVTLEKQDKKTCYVLNEDKVREIIASLEATLL